MVIEKNNIYNMDCLEGMKLIPDGSVSLVVTDPPYLMPNQHGGGNGFLGKKSARLRQGTDWIASDFDYEACFNEMLRICKTPHCIIFCSNKQVSRTMMFFEERNIPTDLLVWQKQNPIPTCNGKYLPEVEFVVYVHGKGATFNNDCPFDFKKKVYTSPLVSPKGRLHPTQKPVDLIQRYILLHSNEGDLICDPFMGSATTAIACINAKRNYVGFELNKEFYDVAVKRIENQSRQLTLF